MCYLSYHDSLTGLHNRRFYEENLSKLDIPENYPLTIVMSDINGLKLINDAFGHSAGDKLLISAAKIFSDYCRETDLIARIGGDEFIVAMPNTSGVEAEKIIDKINKEAKKITIESIELSISFGFETKNEVHENIQEIYRTAEDLMYRVKLIEIPSMRSGAIKTILNTLYEKDKSSEIHSRIVSQISEKIAVAYGMNRQEVAEVKTAGLLHDIGKIIIPIEIITKEGKLTSEEYNLIKGHPEIGFRILNSSHDMRNISTIVLGHHERWDGLGYPRGIKTDEIPIQSRIIAIADTFDAMTSERTYREVCTNKQALDEIIRCSGTQFDPKLVKVFADNFEKII
ncbi:MULTISPECIES: bifunctional diguanylate cyclase/phosphohydrolase [Psychrilyobacter]|uniref:bifunctional diguanylate cyclase/phosphohydrolase n=1 Tax=Psychrilyobacter TaxID=623282 RepID=UPI0021017175|nr:MULTISPECIES: HD domain-containing phosphohydrolase [Psychrilyobacter]MCS5422561.1 diguanylate cyclase [Psychrilyobacter sp. S5]